MKKSSLVIFIALTLFLCFASISFGEAPADKKKHTTLGLYATAKEAYKKWEADQNNVKIIDCRTPEEYIYVGHAPMSYNIPSKFTTYQYDEKSKGPVMKDNPDFVSAIKAKFKPADILMVMCRSGHRSAESVNKLAEAGFTQVYNISDGFEGDKINDPENYYNGLRLINGWKNSGNTWTYALDPKLMFLSESK